MRFLLKDALEEERKYTLQQLNNERQMVDKSRDELMNEQRRILANCHEEQRRVTAEKANLEEIQRKYNRENLDKVSYCLLFINRLPHSK